MPLPIPDLFSKKYQQIIGDLVDSIPKYNKEWTNFNPSDPGITILELLSWISENILYRINKLPQQAYLNFLRLVVGASGEEIDRRLDEVKNDKAYSKALSFLKEIEDRHLFSVSIKHQKELDTRILSQRIKHSFLSEGYLLSPRASVAIIKTGQRWTIDDSHKYLVTKADNVLHIFQKGKPTNILEIKSAAAQFMNARYRAITEEDFQILAIEATKGLDAQVKRAIIIGHPNSGKIEVIIVSDKKNKYAQLIPIVERYLEERKLVGTVIYVRAPVYTSVNIYIKVTSPFHYSKEEAQKQVAKIIENHLDPISGGHDGKGWQYGKPFTIYDIARMLEKTKAVIAIHKITLDKDIKMLEKQIQGLVNVEMLEVDVELEGEK